MKPVIFNYDRLFLCNDEYDSTKSVALDRIFFSEL